MSDRIIFPTALNGTLCAPPSKSAAHRELICAALTQTNDLPTSGEIIISPISTSNDIAATLDALKIIGSDFTRHESSVIFHGFTKSTNSMVLNCYESGSTLRFILPIACALGISAMFIGEGRLPNRPIDALYNQLQKRGTVFSDAHMPFSISGKLMGGHFSLPGNVSSQFISGLLFALPLLECDSELTITTPLQSAAYIDMTINSLHNAGIIIHQIKNGFIIQGRQKYHAINQNIEGDWSNAAFWLCAGAINGNVTLTGLHNNSAQGDRVIVQLLRDFGADILESENSVTVRKSALHCCRIDAGTIPDLVPILAVTAAFANGDTEIYNAARLRIKESDRLSSTCALIRDLGGNTTEYPDRIVIHGGKLYGGKVKGFNDHRIVMSAAIAALGCDKPVTVTESQAVCKSYPDFFDDLNKIGGISDVVNVGNKI